jgi:hypothetical protein
VRSTLSFCFACLVAASVLFFAARADEKEDPEAILRAYLAEVARLPFEDRRRMVKDDAGLKKLHELGEKHLLKNKEVLHKKAVAEYLSLPAWKPDKTVTLKAMESGEDFKDLVRLFGPRGYGVGKGGYEYHVAQWWEAEVAARFLRQRVYSSWGYESPQSIHKRLLEAYAPARVYRQGADPEHPIIAFFDGEDLFAFHLIYTDAGFYALERIDWFRVTLPK